MQLIKWDCLEKMKHIPDGSIDCIIADMPYWTTACKWDVVIPFEPMWEQLKRIIKPNGAIVLFGIEPFSSKLRTSSIKNFKYDWIWDKTKWTWFLNAKKQPMRNHEIISIFYSRQPTYNPQKTKWHKEKISCRWRHLQTDVYWKMNNDYRYKSTERYPRSIQAFSTDTQNSSLHPTQKPVALIEYLIKTYTNEWETVLDFTMWSWTCGVACKNTNRDFIWIEKDEVYFEIAKKRILIDSL